MVKLQAASKLKLNDMRNFKEQKIWQKGFEFAVDAYKLIESFTNAERFALGQQATKAAISIPSNMTERSSGRTDKDYRRFIEISLGSSFGLEALLLIAQAVNLGDKHFLINTLAKIGEEQIAHRFRQQTFIAKLVARSS